MRKTALIAACVAVAGAGLWLGWSRIPAGGVEEAPPGESPGHDAGVRPLPAPVLQEPVPARIAEDAQVTNPPPVVVAPGIEPPPPRRAVAPAWAGDVAAAHEQLAAGGEDAWLDLADRIESTTDAQKKWALAEILARWNRTESIPDLIDMLPEVSDPAVLHGVTTALAGMMTYESLNEVERLYRSSTNVFQRERIAAMVWSIGHTNATRWAYDYLQAVDPSSEDPLGDASLAVLARSSSVSDLQWLVQESKSAHPARSEAAGEALAAVEEDVALPLLLDEALGRGAGSTESSRMGAIRALGNFDSPTVRDALGNLVRYETSPRLNEAAADALSALGAPDLDD